MTKLRSSAAFPTCAWTTRPHSTRRDGNFRASTSRPAGLAAWQTSAATTARTARSHLSLWATGAWPARVSPFAHVLIGGAHASSFGVASTGFAVAIGAGIDTPLPRRISWRIIQGDYLPEHLLRRHPKQRSHLHGYRDPFLICSFSRRWRAACSSGEPTAAPIWRIAVSCCF